MAIHAMLSARPCRVSGRLRTTVMIGIGVVIALAGLGCESNVSAGRAYEFTVRVNGDPGHAVADAVLTFKSQAVAKSNASGLAKLSAHGQEGESLEFGVSCPDGFRSPTSPLSVRLTRLSASGGLPEYQVICAPALRNVVVAVRATNGADLPVQYLGREVARTDSSGTAHFMLRVEPGDELEVKLDTQSKRWLKPQDPTVRFLTRSEDELFVFDQPFVVPRENRHSPVTSGKGPIRIH